MRCNRVMIRVIQKEVMKFLALVLANFGDVLNTNNFAATCT